jgi:hypothetical protein
LQKCVVEDALAVVALAVVALALALVRLCTQVRKAEAE